MKTYYFSYTFAERNNDHGFGSRIFDISGRLTGAMIHEVADKIREMDNHFQVVVLSWQEVEKEPNATTNNE